MSLTPRTARDLQKDFCFQYRITCTKPQTLPICEITAFSSTITKYSTLVRKKLSLNSVNVRNAYEWALTKQSPKGQTKTWKKYPWKKISICSAVAEQRSVK